MVDSSLAYLDSPILSNTGIVFIEQFVQDVVDFSSQYGSDISISYTAYNISGKPSKYPDYGDFPQAFVMVSYLYFLNTFYFYSYILIKSFFRRTTSGSKQLANVIVFVLVFVLQTLFSLFILHP